MNSSFHDPRFISAPGDPAGIKIYGGKGANLRILTNRGFPVPAFEIWTVDYFRKFLEGSGIFPEMCRSDQDFQELISGLRGAPLPDKLRTELEGIRERLGPGPICVRSSGTAEDLTDRSFAGQYETVLDISNLGDLEEAVKHCWSSMFQPRVRAYFQANSLSMEKLGMALIFQRFIKADFSGVTFSVNPLTGRQNHLLMEFCEGSGDKLVSGKITPQSLIFDHKNEKMISGTLPPGMSQSHLSMFRKIQAVFGTPQDIEWVFHDGKLLIVQSRPITKIDFEPSIGTWTTADFRDGGVSSTPVSPFMWSLYEYIWQYSMPRYFEIIKLLDSDRKNVPWGEVFFGRPYWNLGEVIHCLLKVPGFDEKNFFSDLGIKTVEGYPFKRVRISPVLVSKIFPTILSLEHYYDSRIKRNKRFREKFAKLTQPFNSGNLANLPKSEFARLFNSLIKNAYFLTETAYFLTIYNSSNAKLDFKVHLDLLNDSGNEIAYINLISGLSRMKHLRPMKDLARIASSISSNQNLRVKILTSNPAEIEQVLKNEPCGGEIISRVRSFIETYGYHSSRELDIVIPRWENDPESVWRLLRSYLRDPDTESTSSHEKRQLTVYRQEVAKARQAFSGIFHRIFPAAKRLFFKNLLRTRSYCWWREEIRDYSSRMYAIIRRFAVEGGRRLGLADREVFWLTWRQLLDGLEGKSDSGRIRKILDDNIEESMLFRNFRNPDELGTGLLTPLRGESPGGGTTHGNRKIEGANSLKGLGCCPGIAEGTVRIVMTLDEADKIRRGDILVTPFTDPGWTPLFYLLGGVITETGGVLSHAAVISREYGIPAILNVPGATRLLREGQRVRLDGSRGLVEPVTQKQ